MLAGLVFDSVLLPARSIKSFGVMGEVTYTNWFRESSDSQGGQFESDGHDFSIRVLAPI